MLARVVKLSGRSQSDVVRDALRRQLAIDLFDQLRDRVAPFAEAQGLLTDEDVFKARVVRVFLDTNVLVAAFATRGLCADVVRTVLAEHELVALQHRSSRS